MACRFCLRLAPGPLSSRPEGAGDPAPSLRPTRSAGRIGPSIRSAPATAGHRTCSEEPRHRSANTPRQGHRRSARRVTTPDVYRPRTAVPGSGARRRSPDGAWRRPPAHPRAPTLARVPAGRGRRAATPRPRSGLAAHLQDPPAVGQGRRLGDDAAGPDRLRSSPPPTSEPRSIRTMPKRGSPARQSAISARYRGSKTCSGIGAWGKSTAERGNIGRRSAPVPAVLDSVIVPTLSRPTARASALATGLLTREGPATRPVLHSLFSVLGSRSGPSRRPSVGAGAALSAGRHTHRRERGLNHTSGYLARRTARGVTESDIGDAGSTRRIALLDRACRWHRQAPFHSGQRRVLQLPLACTSSIRLARLACEPHANRAFANDPGRSGFAVTQLHQLCAAIETGRAGIVRTRAPRSTYDLSHATPHPQREHHRPRDRSPRRASAPRSRGSWPDAATASPWWPAARTGSRRPGRRIGRQCHGPRRGDRGRPHRRRLARRAPGTRSGRRGLTVDILVNNAGFTTMGPVHQSRPPGRARHGAHQRRGRRRPVHALRPRHGDAATGAPSSTPRRPRRFSLSRDRPCTARPRRSSSRTGAPSGPSSAGRASPSPRCAPGPVETGFAEAAGHHRRRGQ